MMQQPIEVTQLDIAFGGKAMKILPAYNEVPKEFKEHQNKWNKFISGWFFNGIDDWPKAREGVNGKLAILNIRACLADF